LDPTATEGRGGYNQTFPARVRELWPPRSVEALLRLSSDQHESLRSNEPPSRRRPGFEAHGDRAPWL